MCKQQIRSSHSANITGPKYFLGHSEDVSKVSPQICWRSALGGQKNHFTCYIPHNFGHHKSMQVWKPLSLAQCLSYMAHCLDESYGRDNALFGCWALPLLCFWVEQRAWMCWKDTYPHLQPGADDPLFLWWVIPLPWKVPASASLRGKDQQLPMIFPPQTLARPLKNLSSDPACFLKARISTLNLINNWRKELFSCTSLTWKSSYSSLDQVLGSLISHKSMCLRFPVVGYRPSGIQSNTKKHKNWF